MTEYAGNGATDQTKDISNPCPIGTPLHFSVPTPARDHTVTSSGNTQRTPHIVTQRHENRGEVTAPQPPQRLLNVTIVRVYRTTDPARSSTRSETPNNP